MIDVKAVSVEDCLGDYGFRVRYTYNEYRCQVEAFEIAARYSNGDRPMFNVKGWVVSLADAVESIDEAQPHISGFIKWDGCSEFEWHETHLCGPKDYRRHFALLEHMYKRAQALMANSHGAPWDGSAKEDAA